MKKQALLLLSLVSFNLVKGAEQEGAQSGAITLSGRGNQVNSVSWSPDSSNLASGSDDRTIRIWERDRDRKEELHSETSSDSLTTKPLPQIAILTTGLRTTQASVAGLRKVTLTEERDTQQMSKKEFEAHIKQQVISLVSQFKQAMEDLYRRSNVTLDALEAHLNQADQQVDRLSQVLEERNSTKT